MGTEAIPAGAAPDVVLRLRRWNLALALLHLVQGILIWVISTDFSLPVTGSFLEMEPGEGLVAVPEDLASIRIGPLVAGFLLLSAAAHLSLATFGRGWYGRMLEREIQPARWIEYSASASLMIVVIAMLAGIYDIASLIVLFAINAAMILFGWVMEVRNERRERVDWLPFWFGVFAGAIPWVAIGVYLFGAGNENGGPPGFVYGIYGSLFAFFNVFAVNMVLQYRRVGRWRDYLYGERVYMLLSLFAKSALAWQVFAGTLRPV